MITEKNQTAARLTRDRILDVARQHFARQGYRNASLSEIAADLGVVKGALYYHITGGKRELLESVMGREDARILAAMTAAAAAETDPGRALAAALEAKLTCLRELTDLLGVGREIGEEIATVLTERDREFTRRERELLDQLIARGEESGAFRRIRPRAGVVASIQATCQALEVDAIYDDVPIPERPFDAMVDLVLRGLEAR